MAQKCVHKGCGKNFTDPEEDCHYHPGPPEFHEGQKGVWTPVMAYFNQALADSTLQAGNAASRAS